MDFRKKKRIRQQNTAPRPFTSLADRRKWMGAKFDGTFNADPAYYKPLLAPGEEGRQAYLKAFAGKWGCGKPNAPTDLEMFAVMLNVGLPRGLDAKVMLHCDECFPCLVKLGRAFHHFVADQPGAAWTEEVGKFFPMKVKSWENDLWHFRVFLASVHNGPSFHVHGLPYDKNKNKKPLIIGSCAGVFGDGNYPIKEMVLQTQKEMEQRAKHTRDFLASLDPVLVVQFARALQFDVDAEIYDFLSELPHKG